ncbi:hypothetical protein G7077_03255 [Sphingomonas piscis]|uniref:Uncharacterized protein n=1 Tax=Sphingomonas piscis TaxID=2714943 RepID=A0A6G7YMV1_9SPHN|nr:hypothetical protein [Sphingomonas piscis]QIK78075.1 hypothetical protein G7077_03255 [Sphingomonas piscis]
MTMLRAEASRELELREALQAQLVEANKEIVASWNRRKEISAVNGNLRTKLSEATAELKQLRSELKKLKSELQTRHEELAAMQRYVVEASISGKAKKLSRRAKGFVRKLFK